MSKNEKCTYKACKITDFDCQICNLEGRCRGCLGSFHFLERMGGGGGGGGPEEFRGGSLTFCLPKKGGSA